MLLPGAGHVDGRLKWRLLLRRLAQDYCFIMPLASMLADWLARVFMVIISDALGLNQRW